jgi:hypothetical protein
MAGISGKSLKEGSESAKEQGKSLQEDKKRLPQAQESEES